VEKDVMDLDTKSPELPPEPVPVQMELETVENKEGQDERLEKKEEGQKQGQDEVEKEEEGQKHEEAVKDVKSFMECVKQTEGHKGGAATASQRKAEIPALRKAAAAREMAERREAERRRRKEQREQWRHKQKKQQLPAKVAGKMDPPTKNKRVSNIEPSPNKKQKIENLKQNTKNAHRAGQARRQMANITPDPMTLTQAGMGKGNVPSASPQYSLTPVGLLAGDTRTKRKERRREKRVPSWAENRALQNSLAAQRNIDPATIFPPLSTLDPTQVFGTPDSMVVRNATERAYNYKHRASSSCDWSEEDD